MKREKSDQAKVAAIIKKALKARGIDCRTSSDSFAGGTSVTVSMTDIPPRTVKAIEAEFAQYQYGHFDGMQDLYEYSNSRDDIPQTKYLFISCTYSDEVKQAAWDWFKAKFNSDEVSAAPDNIAELGSYSQQIYEHWADQMLWRVVSGVEDAAGSTYWDNIADSTAPAHSQAAPETAAGPAETGPDALAVSVRVNPDKNGLEVEFIDKPPASTREKLKAAGFRWSRRLGYWYAKQTAEALALAEVLRPDHEATTH